MQMLTRMMFGLVMTGLLAGPALAGRQVFDEGPGGQVRFMTPSSNIGCLYRPAGSGAGAPEDGGPQLSCDRQQPNFRRFTLSRSGKAVMTVNPSGSPCCGRTEILNTGNSWSLDGFVCTVRDGGLACKRGAHGFFISRKKTSVH